MRTIQLMMATQTGNAEDAANRLKKSLAAAGHVVEWVDLSLRKDAAFLHTSSIALAVVSTWGDGEPPDDAVPFFDSLRRSSPMGFSQLRVAVLALGDSNYDQFCESGKELERELLRHGAGLLAPRVDCDDDFSDGLTAFTRQVLTALEMEAEAAATPHP